MLLPTNQRTLLAGVAHRPYRRNSNKRILLALIYLLIFNGMLSLITYLIIISIKSGGSDLNRGSHKPDATAQLSLFDPDDYVKILTKDNIFSFVQNSEIPTVILFYSVYCGGCKSFSPIYKKYSALVLHWDINVASLNCVSPNTDVCYHMDVSSFPYIRISKPSSSLSVENSQQLHLNFGDKILLNMLSDTADHLIKSYFMYGRTKRLEELTNEKLDKFYKSELVEEILIVFVGFDEEEKLLKITFIDVYKCPKVSVAYISQKRVSDFSGLSGYASKVVVALGSDRKTNVIIDKVENDDYTRIRTKLSDDYSRLCPEFASLKSALEYDPGKVPVIQTLPSLGDIEVNYEDIVKGLGISLRNEISMVNLDREKFTVVKNYLTIVLECFPWMSVQSQFLSYLRQWLLSQNGKVMKEDFRKIVKSERAFFAFPEDLSWNSCKGTEPTFRGFPCSMWLLFHVMATKCEKPSINGSFTGIDVLLAVRGYVTNFFMCLTCREHFREMSKEVEKELKTPTDALKWLWISHNRVNARISKSSTEDPNFPKVQFPLSSTCPECHNVENVDSDKIIETNPGFNFGKHAWNLPETLNFLRIHYSVENLRIPNDFISRYGNETFQLNKGNGGLSLLNVN